MEANQDNIFSLFEETQIGEEEEQSRDELLSILEHMAEQIEQIELNTRWRSGVEGGIPGGGHPLPVVPAERVRGGASAFSDTQKRKSSGKPDSGSVSVSEKKQPSPSDPKTVREKPDTPPAVKHEKAKQEERTKTNTAASSRKEDPGHAIVASGTPSVSSGILSHPREAASEKPDSSSPKTKSQEALEVRRQEAAAQKASTGLMDAFKKNLSGWDGTFAGKGTEDAEDAVGLAVAGPVWGAVQEVKGVFDKLGEDENSLVGTLKKTLADKTGITAANAWIDKKKEGIRNRTLGWGGAEASPVPGHGDNGRDAQGRFRKKQQKNVLPKNPVASDAEKKQAEVAEQSLRLDIREAKNEEVRHEELIAAIRGISGDSLMDTAGDLLRMRRGGGGGSLRGSGRGPRVATPKRPGLLRRAGQSLLKGGKALAGGTVAAGGILAGGLGAGGGSAKASATVASSMARIGSGAGKLAPGAGVVARPAVSASRGLLKLGGKAALGGARAIPVLGQILAAGLAIKDGFDGWADTEGQKEAFGLKEGQEATAGQKASMSAANILDMGGLLTGGASLLGMDINTSDIARTLYDATSLAGNVASELKSSAVVIASNIGKGIGEMSDTLMQKTSELWTVTSQTVSASVNSAIASAGGLLDNAKTCVSEAMSSIEEKALGLWGVAKEKASSAAGAVASAAGTLTEAAGEAWANTKEKASVVASSISERASGVWGATKSFFGFEEDEDKKGTTKTVVASPAAPKEKPSLAAMEETAHPQPILAEKALSPSLQITPDFTEDKPRTRTAESADHSLKSSVAVTDKAELEDLGGDATIIADPSEEMSGMFETLTGVLETLNSTIRSGIEREKKDSPMSGVGGILSGFGTAFQKTASTLQSISAFVRGGGPSGSGGGSRQTPSLYAYQQAREMSAQGLGALSAQYESGSRGSSAIGWDATGGTSYGKYQISSKAGTMDEFLKFAKERNPEVYQRLNAAGPADTGGKNGEFVNVWQSLVSEGKMGKLEHEFIKKSHFDPAFASIKSEELRNKIQGSRALQDVLWSTAVQHRGRTGDILNGVWKNGMSDEDLVKAIYENRANRFSSSSANIQVSARRRMRNESQNALAMLANEQSDSGIAKAFSVGNMETGQKLASAASASIMASTQNAIDRGVAYRMGGKNSKEGSIDCSGWVTEQSRALMESVNEVSGKEIFGKEARQVLRKGSGGGAAGIIKAVSEATGEQLTNADLSPDKIREGMAIGMDTGEHGWDAGRYKGIDHIVQTFRDPETGQMMVSESSGKVGVHATPYEDWYKRYGNSAKLYGTDMLKLADASKLDGVQDSVQSTVASVVPVQASPAAQGSLPANPEQRFSPESIREMQPQSGIQQNNDSTMLLRELKDMFAQLIVAVKNTGQENSKRDEKEGFQNIRVDFDDPYTCNIAHDRM